MRTILAVGQDKELLWSRSRVLRQCKAEITSANGAEALNLLRTRRFDLVILCHTLSSTDLFAVAQLAHEQVEFTTVLQVVASAEPDSEDAVADILVPSDPETLVTTVANILGCSSE
jgi:CheY-like chemotaxis protein